MCYKKKKGCRTNELEKMLDSLEFTAGPLRLLNIQICISHFQDGEQERQTPQTYFTCFSFVALGSFGKLFGKMLFWNIKIVLLICDLKNM